MSNALELIKLIDGWMGEDKDFTCFDVTKKMRENGSFIPSSSLLDSWI